MRNPTNEYEKLKAKLEESCRKEEARQRILRRKRDERRAIRKAGGGASIAKAILGGKNQSMGDTSFGFGHNVPDESIDERIAREQAERCLERVYCPACKKHHGLCAEITEEKERLKMLPTGEDQGNNRRQRTGGLNFINNQDLTDQPQEAKILMVKFTEKGKQGPSITLKLAFKNEMRYLWVPCRKTDQRYATLLGEFGPNENNWVDKRIVLLLEKDEFSEGFRTAVGIPKEAKKGGRG